MDTIRNYLDNLFASLPKTAQILRLHDDLLATMEDKYRELKAAGRSENEAIGVVISEFGNIEELLQELDIPAAAQEEPPAQEPVRRVAPAESLPVVELAEADAYMQAKTRMGMLVGLGVLACILAPGFFLVLQAFFPIREFLGFGAFFALVAVGVALFITGGSGQEQFRHIQKEPFRLHPETEQIIREQRQSALPNLTRMLVVGIVLCILSPNGIFWLPHNHALGEALGFLLMFVLAGVGVCLIVFQGNIRGGYTELLQEGEFTVQRKMPKHSNKIIAAIAAVWWPLVAAGYLLYSFLTWNWHISWVVWPVSGILFGALSALLSILSGDAEQ